MSSRVYVCMGYHTKLTAVAAPAAFLSIKDAQDAWRVSYSAVPGLAFGCIGNIDGRDEQLVYMSGEAVGVIKEIPVFDAATHL